MTKPTKPQTPAVAPEAAILNAMLQGHACASYRDTGYAIAVLGDAKVAIGKSALQNIPGFPDAIPEEVENEIKAGITARKYEITAATFYVKDGHDKYEQVKTAPDPKDGKGFVLTPQYACAYTTHELGKLKKEQPNLHRMVTEARNAVRKYVSNRYAALLAAGKADTERERGETVLFADRIKDFMDNLPKKAKSALARGDSTAPDASKLGKAIAAFWVELK